MGETDLAIHIMREVGQWCIDAACPMWTLEELSREALLKHSPEENDFRVARVGGEPVAAMILQWQDREFWPEIAEGDSGFIHKLCVRRAFAGIGLSTCMVNAAAAECRKRGAGFLRLDTYVRRPKLCSLYEGMGFVKVGYRSVGGREYALYELKI
ncbi:MAG: GNAT family N-acetyltransferase [Spirochaetia bacterium]